jgi:antitoxin component of RelBE/YafQ-DinJ toxin-antitoxin module
MKNDRNIIKATFSIDKHMLELAETIFKELGLTLDLGIAVYLYQVVYTSSIPFSIKLPPQEMIERVDLYKKLMKGRDDIKAGRVVSGDILFEEIIPDFGFQEIHICIVVILHRSNIAPIFLHLIAKDTFYPFVAD